MSNNVSDFNLTKITTKELSENLKTTIEFGGNVYIVARRGSGKSIIAKDTIKNSFYKDKNGKNQPYKELYLNISTFDRPDLGGYPNFFAAQEGRGYVNFLLPQFYECLIEGNVPVVALLDEVDKAESALWAPLLEFTQFHTINGRALPNLKAIIMTGNLQAEGGMRPCLPLLDRAEKYLMEASHTHWLDWASKTNEIHPSITAFIADHPEELFGDVDPGDIYADPSPRGWHNASNLISFGEKNKWSHSILTNKVAGCVGKKAGIKYSSYFDHYQVLLPIIEQIIRGENVKGFNDLEQSKQMVASMIVCSRLSRSLDEMQIKEKETKVKEMPLAAKTVAKFMKNIDPEMALISVRSQIGLDRVLKTGLDEESEWDLILKDIAKKISG